MRMKEEKRVNDANAAVAAVHDDDDVAVAAVYYDCHRGYINALCGRIMMMKVTTILMVMVMLLIFIFLLVRLRMILMAEKK